ncbi:MAG: hypothetical protein J6M39_06505 [Lachnospiraceae bacterium]|nr:hypothetical protein [Lachnospiraceae bacterium]
MKKVLLYIWQLPQNLLGLILLLFYRKEQKFNYKDGVNFYETPEMPTGISLGQYVIVRNRYYIDNLKHEYGHTKQSKYLGWFYLIIIGLPSLIGNLIDRIVLTNILHWPYNKSSKWYYNLPWEKWADKLGNVTRKFNVNL